MRLTPAQRDQLARQVAVIKRSHADGPDSKLTLAVNDHIWELEKDVATLKSALRKSYQGGAVDETTDVQYVGVYVLRWHDHPDQPTVGFRSWTDDEIDALLATDVAPPQATE